MKCECNYFQAEAFMSWWWFSLVLSPSCKVIVEACIDVVVLAVGRALECRATTWRLATLENCPNPAIISCIIDLMKVKIPFCLTLPLLPSLPSFLHNFFLSFCFSIFWFVKVLLWCSCVVFCLFSNLSMLRVTVLHESFAALLLKHSQLLGFQILLLLYLLFLFLL